MKITQITSKVLFILALLITISCSNDKPVNDNPTNNIPTVTEGESHTYNLSFSGGEINGKTFSGNLPNKDMGNGAYAIRQQYTNSENVWVDEIALVLNNGNSDDEMGVSMILQMNNDQAKNFGPTSIDDSSSLTIMYGNYLMSPLSGTSNITNYGEITNFLNVVYAYFTITFNAEMQVLDITNGAQFTTQLSGSISINRYFTP
ncbi:hypothetical protein [Bizionia myxarmorum]|uniref:DUF5017 domain-containing protein n=1 Tax=Bizionia myxarmorum TaxID=291186 RepID=A0A5D0R7B5_9FLAO|nr:hypothetical protein [Bizionia myxarmorum]TYB76454.1 hypothetical protein ES674_12805 [Bizionia myxarmorum]